VKNHPYLNNTAGDFSESVPVFFLSERSLQLGPVSDNPSKIYCHALALGVGFSHSEKTLIGTQNIQCARFDKDWAHQAKLQPQKLYCYKQCVSQTSQYLSADLQILSCIDSGSDIFLQLSACITHAHA
jgi:hypothetical protein